jgi:hypothetical protein
MDLDLSIARICEDSSLKTRAMATMLKVKCSFFPEPDVLKSIPAAVPHACRLWAVSPDNQRVTA